MFHSDPAKIRKDALRAPTSTYKRMADFFLNASADLNAVKVAWRNRVMHVHRKHTLEEAREIYNATCGLMRYIAENLQEDKGSVASIRGMINR